MPTPVPTPVAAALGLVPTVLDGVRRLPGKAVLLPVYAVSHALTSIGTARQGYDSLAERGERLIARLRGTSFDELEDVFEDKLKGTPLARPYDRVEDTLEDATESVTALVRKSGTRARKAAGTATRTVGEGLDKAAGTVEEAAEKVAEKPAAEQPVPEAEAPKGQPTPSAPAQDSTRVTTAAAPEVVETVERVTAVVGAEVLAHDDLPLPDYDHLTLGSLRSRMRSLDLPQLIQVRDYEKAHADRLPIVTMLDNRIAKLAVDPTAPLSGGSGAAPVKPAPAGGSKVSPATAAPATSAPGVAHGGLGDQPR